MGHYVYDGSQRVLTYDGETDLLTNRSTWAPGVDQLLTDEVFDGLGNLTDTLWAATDRNGSVNDLLDTAGTVVEHRKYDSFGAIDQTFDAAGAAKTSANLLSDTAFAGRTWDQDAGLYYNRARWYEPESGRFISEDPATDGNNWYAYAGNNPVTFVDPSGLSIQSPLSNLGIGNSLSNASTFGSFGGSSFSTSRLDTGFGFSGPVAPSASGIDRSFAFDSFNHSNAFGTSLNQANIPRFADQFQNTQTITDNGGRTRMVADIGGQQVAFDPRTGVETGELLNTLRGQGGGSFQTFASPEIARNLIILENPSTIELVDAATTVVGGGGAVRQFATRGLRAGLTATGIFAAEEIFERTTGLPSLNPVSLVRGRIGVSASAPKGTTILGNGQTTRVVPFAERTGARTLDNGLTEAQWNALSPRQQFKVNDGQLRKHINSGDRFRDIGPDGRARSLDLREAELLRLRDRSIPVERVSPEELRRIFGK